MKLPGGVLEYIGNFLTQGYISALYGSLVGSAIYVVIYVTFLRISRELSSYKPLSNFLALLPSLILLLSQNSKDHILTYNLGYLLVAFVFLFSIRLRKNRLVVTTIFIVPAFYFIAGSFVFIFLLMFVMYSITFESGKNRIFFPLMLSLAALIVFIVYKEFLFLQPVNKLLNSPIDLIGPHFHLDYTFFLSMLIVLYPLLTKIVMAIKMPENLIIKLLSNVILLVFPVIFMAKKTGDSSLLYIENLVSAKNWDVIVKKKERYISKGLLELYYYNLALSNNGELCESLFSVDQDYMENALWLPRNGEYIDESIYFYYTIGLMNEVHHMAYESMVKGGLKPESIKFLIITNLINGNYKVAEKYIHVLKKTLFYRKCAIKYEEMLHNPLMVSSDPEIACKIRLLPVKNFFIRPDDLQNIELLLWANPFNEKAFEYKMAYLLLSKDIEALIYEVKMFEKLGYEQIPLHIEEAVILYKSKYGECPDIGEIAIRPCTASRFQQYFFDKANTKNPLGIGFKHKWENTYWYYYEFR